MGMSASQARLLSITSRMHDIELKAQNIENQKVSLATQKDELYREYMDALDAKKIQVAYNNGYNYIDANFATVCKYNENRTMQYALKDTKTGKVIVDEDVAKVYENYNTDKYAFAWAMMGFEEIDGESMMHWGDSDDYSAAFIGTSNGNGDEMVAMSEVEQKVYDKYKDSSSYSTLKKKYDAFIEKKNDPNVPTSEVRDALNDFRDELYNTLGDKIYNYIRLDKNDSENTDPEAENAVFNSTYAETFDKVKGEFDFYVHLFEEIDNCGGCITVDNFSEDGDFGNEWFNDMINSGQVVIDMYNKSGKKGWEETSVATSTNQNYLQEVADDANLKKAEAKYEYELGIINKKDTNFDKDLSNLETQRTALKTEMDAIKTVKDDNIERGFGIFG